MSGVSGHVRNGDGMRTGCYQQAGNRAVRLEVRGYWLEAAEAWRRAACVAPRTDWRQFALKRAEQCHRRCRGEV